MVDANTVASDARIVAEAVAQARSGLVDREVLADVVVLCAVAGEHALIVGPPGTAKSEAIRRVARRLGESYFEYLVGRFTEPNEIFGPVDLRALREGVVQVETTGMLPEAEIAFLDEVFLGSTAILNALLGLLNERIYRRGSTIVQSPLRVCVAACNVLPEDPALAAFADRFLARVFVDPVSDDRLEELLEKGWAGDAHRTDVRGESLAGVLDRLTVAARSVDVSGAVFTLATAIRRLRSAGVLISDRRAVRAQRLLAAAAVLDGRLRAGAEDLWVLPLIAPSADGQAMATSLLADLIDTARNQTLPHASEAFSQGPAARAHRLATVGADLLAELDVEPTADERLRIEAVLREIDASFGPDDLPEHLVGVRGALLARMAAGEPEPARV